MEQILYLWNIFEEDRHDFKEYSHILNGAHSSKGDSSDFFMKS